MSKYQTGESIELTGDAPNIAGSSRPLNFSSSVFVRNVRQAGVTLGFEDVLGDNSSMTNGYGNLSYTNLYNLHRSAVATVPGYTNNMTGNMALFSGNNATATISSGGANFDFLGLNIGAAYRNGMTVAITGYDDGTIVYTHNVVLTAATPLTLDLNWAGVDTITFAGTGGATSTGSTTSGGQIVYDQLRIGGAHGSISGTIFNDLDRDGVRDAGEAAVKSQVVYADVNGNGIQDADEPFATTDRTGAYTIGDLAFGTYQIRQALTGDKFDTTRPTADVPTYADAVASADGFTDIRTTGTALNFSGSGTLGPNSDEGFVKVNLAAPISYYGREFTSLTVSANGYIEMVTNGINNGYNNTPVASGGLKGIIAPFWDDLEIGTGGNIYFQDDAANSRVIVQWTGMRPYGVAGASTTFQAIIGYDGDVQFNYLDATGTYTATIGLTDPSGLAGEQFAYNVGAPAANTTLSFAPSTYSVPTPMLVEVDAGANVTGADLGQRHVGADAGRIVGTLFDDNNGNGTFDRGDVAKAGWTVFLDTNNNGLHDVGEQITQSTAAGKYSFRFPDAGTYSVVASAPLTFEKFTFDASTPNPTVNGDSPREVLAAAVAAAEAADRAAGGVRYAAADFTQAHVDGELVVKLDADAMARMGATGDTVAALMAQVGARLVDQTVGLGIQLWSVSGDVQAAEQALSKSGLFRYVQPNYTVDMIGAAPTATTNDPGNGLTWGLDDSNTPEAWDYSTGSSSVVVGVIDSGIDIQHPDLVDNLWTNKGEVAGDGIDNDNNGYVDDTYGWNFVRNTNDVDDKTNGHGTHVAGTIGGVGNNGIGITGVNQDLQMMAIRIFDTTNGATTAATQMMIAKAIEYATMMGADLTNNSWGGGAFSAAIRDAIAAGPLFVNSAGNSGVDNDRADYWPSNYPLDNILTVAAINSLGTLSGFSQYGKVTVDMAAPGVAVLSTVPTELGSYAYYDGTSMAGPHVAGAAALLLSIDPTLTSAELKQALMAGVRQTGELADKTVSGGTLDILGAINALNQESKTVTVAAGQTVTLDFAVTGGASSGADTLSGFAFAETIDGGAGDDALSGGRGNDTLIGGRDNDTLTGGDGADTFVFRKADGVDTIIDFDRAEGDTITINYRQVNSIGDLRITQFDEDTAMVRFSGTTIYLEGVQADTLDESAFVFNPQLMVAGSIESFTAHSMIDHVLV